MSIIYIRHETRDCCLAVSYQLSAISLAATMLRAEGLELRLK